MWYRRPGKARLIGPRLPVLMPLLGQAVQREWYYRWHAFCIIHSAYSLRGG